MATEQVSLRLDGDVLGKVDDEARRRGLTRTQMIEEALHYWMTRSAIAGGLVPGGFTQPFHDLLVELAKTGGYVTLLTLDPTGRPWVFTGAVLKHDATSALASGFLSIRVQESDHLTQGPEVPIPRASIIA